MRVLLGKMPKCVRVRMKIGEWKWLWNGMEPEMDVYDIDTCGF